jgi:hypothetical protein
MTDSTSHNHRPRLTRWLALLTTLLALHQIVSAIRVLQLPDDLAGQVSLVIPLEVIAGRLWAGLFVLITLALVRKHIHALRYAGWALIGFVFYSIARLIIFSRADYDQGRLPFLLVAAVIMICVPAVFLILRKRGISRQAREKDHHGSRPKD